MLWYVDCTRFPLPFQFRFISCVYVVCEVCVMAVTVAMCSRLWDLIVLLSHSTWRYSRTAPDESLSDSNLKIVSGLLESKSRNLSFVLASLLYNSTDFPDHISIWYYWFRNLRSGPHLYSSHCVSSWKSFPLICTWSIQLWLCYFEMNSTFQLFSCSLAIHIALLYGSSFGYM